MHKTELFAIMYIYNEPCADTSLTDTKVRLSCALRIRLTTKKHSKAIAFMCTIKAYTHQVICTVPRHILPTEPTSD